MSPAVSPIERTPRSLVRSEFKCLDIAQQCRQGVISAREAASELLSLGSIGAYYAGEIALHTASSSEREAASFWLGLASDCYTAATTNEQFTQVNPGIEFAARAFLRNRQMLLYRSVFLEGKMPDRDQLQYAYRRTLQGAMKIEAISRTADDLVLNAATMRLLGFLGEAAVLLLGQRKLLDTARPQWLPLVSFYFEDHAAYFDHKKGSGWDITFFSQPTKASNITTTAKVQVRTVELPNEAPGADGISIIHINPDLRLSDNDPGRLSRRIIQICNLERVSESTRAHEATQETLRRASKLLKVIGIH